MHFLWEARHSLLLGALDSTLAPQLGGVLKSSVTNKNHKKVETIAPNRPEKVYGMNVNARKQNGACFDSARNTHDRQFRSSDALHMCANEQQNVIFVTSILQT
jgi:hypothetical protein